MPRRRRLVALAGRAGIRGGLPTVQYVVAEEDRQLVGYAVASIVADIAELQRIAVTGTHRRTGIATALLEAITTRARAGRADRLLLEVRENNEAALAFYAAHGFLESTGARLLPRRRHGDRDAPRHPREPPRSPLDCASTSGDVTGSGPLCIPSLEQRGYGVARLSLVVMCLVGSLLAPAASSASPARPGRCRAAPRRRLSSRSADTASRWACAHGGRSSVRTVQQEVRCGDRQKTHAFYTAGGVNTYHRFSQAFGRFEARFKVTATDQPGLQEAFWLWPDVRSAARSLGRRWRDRHRRDLLAVPRPRRPLPSLHLGPRAAGSTRPGTVSPSEGCSTPTPCSGAPTGSRSWSTERPVSSTEAGPGLPQEYIIGLTQMLGGTGTLPRRRAAPGDDDRRLRPRLALSARLPAERSGPV